MSDVRLMSTYQRFSQRSEIIEICRLPYRVVAVKALPVRLLYRHLNQCVDEETLVFHFTLFRRQRLSVAVT